MAAMLSNNFCVDKRVLDAGVPEPFSQHDNRYALCKVYHGERVAQGVGMGVGLTFVVGLPDASGLESFPDSQERHSAAESEEPVLAGDSSPRLSLGRDPFADCSQNVGLYRHEAVVRLSLFGDNSYGI